MNFKHDIDITEDPHFYQWVFDSNQEVEQYWRNYFENDPEHKKKAEELKLSLQLHFSTSKDVLLEQEKERISNSIKFRIEGVKKKSHQKLRIHRFLQYAAVAFLFFALGGGIAHFGLREEKSLLAEVGYVPVDNLNDRPVLLLDNKQKIELKKKDSEVRHSSKGEIQVDDNRLVLAEKETGAVHLNTLKVPFGSRTSVELSDGTKVWVNAGSQLLYPSLFEGKQREVILIGEAFFDVAENKDKPFIVKTETLDVRVLGTEFNVSAYPNEPMVQTVLTEGKVEIVHNGFFDHSIELSPGEMAVSRKSNNETKVYEVDVEYYTVWVNGIFTFSNQDLNRILKRVERYYNTTFLLDNSLDGMMKISGKLDIDRGRKEVIEYFELLTGLNFIEQGENNFIIRK